MTQGRKDGKVMECKKNIHCIALKYVRIPFRLASGLGSKLIKKQENATCLLYKSKTHLWDISSCLENCVCVWGCLWACVVLFYYYLNIYFSWNLTFIENRMVPRSKGKIIHQVTKIPKKYFFLNFLLPSGKVGFKGGGVINGWKEIGMHNSVSLMNKCCFGETRWWDVGKFFALLYLSK